MPARTRAPLPVTIAPAVPLRAMLRRMRKSRSRPPAIQWPLPHLRCRAQRRSQPAYRQAAAHLNPRPRRHRPLRIPRSLKLPHYSKHQPIPSIFCSQPIYAPFIKGTHCETEVRTYKRHCLKGCGRLRYDTTLEV